MSERRPSFWPRRDKESAPLPEDTFYDEAKAIQRAWFAIQGESRNVIDFDLTGGNHSERILYDLLKNEAFKYQMNKIIDRLSETLERGKAINPGNTRDPHLHDFALGHVSALVAFGKRQRGDSLDKARYIEDTQQVPLVESSKEMKDDQLDTIHQLAEKVGADLSDKGFQQWRREHVVDPETAQRQLYVAGLNTHRDKSRFIGERERTLPVEIQAVHEAAYYYAWSDTNKQTGNFEVKQNFGTEDRPKYWTPGKSEELGGHEFCQHCGRMLKRKEQIQSGKLHPLFGQTTTQGPESTVEEGLAMTIPFFLPGAYDRLTDEGKMQIHMTLYKHLRLGDAQLRLIKDPSYGVRNAAREAKRDLTWEPIEEIIKDLEERTQDPSLESYKRGYTEGARRHIIYPRILSERGSQEFLRAVDEKPYKADQEALLVDAIAGRDRRNIQSNIKGWIKDEFRDIVVSSIRPLL